MNFLGNIGIISSLLLWIFTFGIGEEAGWRGFALNELLAKYSFKKSIVILFIFWFSWHIPFFFYNDSIASKGLLGLVAYGISLLCGTIILGYLYKINNNSIIPVAIWHGTFNWITASQGLPSQIQIIMGFIVVVWALLIWKRS